MPNLSGQTGSLFLSALLKNQNLADTRVHIPLSCCAQFIALQAHRNTVLLQFFEKLLLKTAVCKNRRKCNNHFISPGTDCTFHRLLSGNTDHHVEPFNILSVLRVHGYGTNIGKRHGIRPILHSKNHPENRRFNKQRNGP